MHSQHTTITHLYQLEVNFTEGHALCIKIKSHYKPLCRTKCSILMPFHAHLCP